MTRLTPKLHSLMTLVSPKSFKCNIAMHNGPIALKLNLVELDLISLLVNVSCELGQIMARYDFLWAR